jgi:hypothetical protein
VVAGVILTGLEELAVNIRPLGLAMSVAIFGVIAPRASAAQTTASTRGAFGALRDQVPQAEGVSAQEVRIHWFVKDARIAAQSAADDLQVVDLRPVLGTLTKERHPELALDKLVVVLVDGAGREVDWRIIPDPRLIRGEFPDANGNLTGQSFRRLETDFFVAIPDMPSLKHLRLYQPRWTGGEFVLDLIAGVDLP